MTGALVLLHVLLPCAVALVAALGAWRCRRLLTYAHDSRLSSLGWFYGLFAASLVPLAIWNAEIAASVSDTPLPSLHVAFASAQSVDFFLLAHHALMIASLAVATIAFSQGHATKTRLTLGVLGLSFGFTEGAPLIPILLAFEAILTLHLAARAVINHARRKTPGALRVAAGFSLFFAGHLSYFLLYHAGAARSPFGDVFALAGIFLLVRLLPRPTA